MSDTQPFRDGCQGGYWDQPVKSNIIRSSCISYLVAYLSLSYPCMYVTVVIGPPLRTPPRLRGGGYSL